MTLVRLPGRVMALLSACVVASGCAGPVVDSSLTVRDQPVDILYGDRTQPPPPPPPLAASPTPGFPGFVAPPAPRPAPVTATTVVTVPPVSVPPPACPELPLGAAPAEVAGSGITGVAPEGPLPFRVDAVTEVDGERFVGPAAETRVVGPSDELVPGLVRFDVTVTRGDLETTTTFQVDQRGVDDGVFISQIVAADPVATEAFTPAQPVKVLPLPVALSATWSSGGIDPLSGVGMVVHGRVTSKATINACGVGVDSWTVTIGPEPTSGAPSRIESAQRNVDIEGTLSIATQFGGLVVASDLVLEGTDDGRDVVIQESIAVNEVPGARS